METNKTEALGPRNGGETRRGNKHEVRTGENPATTGGLDAWSRLEHGLAEFMASDLGASSYWGDYANRRGRGNVDESESFGRATVYCERFTGSITVIPDCGHEGHNRFSRPSDATQPGNIQDVRAIGHDSSSPVGDGCPHCGQKVGASHPTGEDSPDTEAA